MCAISSLSGRLSLVESLDIAAMPIFTAGTQGAINVLGSRVYSKPNGRGLDTENKLRKTAEMLSLPVALPHYCARLSLSGHPSLGLLPSVVLTWCNRSEYFRYSLPTQTRHLLRWEKPRWEDGYLFRGNHFAVAWP